MKKSQIIISAAIVALMFVGQTGYSAKSVGDVHAVYGKKEELKNKRAGKMLPLNVKDDLLLKDTVITGKSSSTTLRLTPADSKASILINVYEGSQFKIEPEKIVKGKRHYVIRLFGGLIETVTRNLKDEELFSVTPNSIAGIRGTDVVALVVKADRVVTSSFQNTSTSDSNVSVYNVRLSGETIAQTATDIRNITFDLTDGVNLASGSTHRTVTNIDNIALFVPNAEGGTTKIAGGKTFTEVTDQSAGGVDILNVAGIGPTTFAVDNRSLLVSTYMNAEVNVIADLTVSGKGLNQSILVCQGRDSSFHDEFIEIYTGQSSTRGITPSGGFPAHCGTLFDG
jgi:hypothetical protein